MASKPIMKVNPILKKWTQTEDSSLDLNHPTDLRDVLSTYDFGMASHKPNDIETSPTTRQGYHNRSTSGTSQFSTGTACSGQRTGSFVHPFQQTPRPFTPPFSAGTHQEPSQSSDFVCSLADEENELRQHHYYTSTSNPSSTYRSHSRSHSLALASTTSNISQQISQTKPSTSRLALVCSYSSLPNQASSNDALPTSAFPSQSSGSVSIEKGFRLRSRSEVISRSRAQSIQEARRKFLEKEMVQEEKAAREEIKQLEKRQQKEALKINRFNHHSSISSKRSRSDLTLHEPNESFLSRTDNSDIQQNLFTPDISPEPRRNASQAKQKTHSAWAIFVIWFRIRLMRLGGKISSKR